MPLLDAVWDPIAGKVVYRDLKTVNTTASTTTTTTTATNTATTTTSSNENGENHTSNTMNVSSIDHSNHDNITQAKPQSSDSAKIPNNKDRRRSRSIKEKKEKKSVVSLDWRNTDETIPQLSSSQEHHDRTRPSMIGAISPSKFHSSDSKAPLPPHQLQATIQILRKEQAYERRAFKEMTCYKSFPLQDHAIQYCQSLQEEWDSSYRYNIESPDDSNKVKMDDPLSSTSSTTSTTSASASSSSSSATPEPKRQIRALHMSPTECTMIQQYRNQFIQTSSVPTKSIIPTTTSQQQQEMLGTALYCLEPRIFAIESKKSNITKAKSDTDNKHGSNNNSNNSGGGRRRYVVAQVGRFMDTYWSKTEPEWRHAYELIPLYTPCRLYLDIECVDHPDLIPNNDDDDSALTTSLSSVNAIQDRLLMELYEELARELQEQYGNQIFHCPNTNQTYKLRPLRRQDIVDLDSSTTTKFSRHWIVHIPVMSVVAVGDETTIKSASSTTTTETLAEALFPDNATVGTFVRQWVGRMAEQHATGQLEQSNGCKTLQKYLFVPKQSNHNNTVHTTSSVEQMSCLIDLGVYTKNRLFRLMGSMKYGKPISAAFRIADTNQFPFRNDFGNDCFYIPAMEQSKDHYGDTPQNRRSNNYSSSSSTTVQQSLSKTDWSTHSDALAQTFVVPINIAKTDFPILPRIVGTMDETRSRTTTGSYQLMSSLQQRPTRSLFATTSSFGKSPYPMIDQYVQHHLANRGGTVGMIRAWSMEVDPTTSKPISISYQMCHNRYCECIRREHKSNNIIWNFNMISKEFYQTCHDPDCRAMNFRGQSIPLPANVRDELNDALFEEDLALLDITDHPPATRPLIVDDATDLFDDDESSFDEALAALNINDLIPPTTSTFDLPIAQVDVSDTLAIQANSNEYDSHDDDDDSYSDLFQLALEINAKKAEREKHGNI